MRELAGEPEEQMLAGQFLDLVGPEFRQPARRLGRCEPGQGTPQAGEGLLAGEPVDVHAAFRRTSGTPGLAVCSA